MAAANRILAALFLLALALAGPAAARAQLGAVELGDASRTRVLYAGFPGGEREQAFVGFLRGWFADVEAIDLRELSGETAAGWDVVVADWRARWQDGTFDASRAPDARLPATFVKPVVLVGAVGGEITPRTKIDWLSHTLQNRAHGLRRDHPIFRAPLAVELSLEPLPPPLHYYDWPAGAAGAKLGDAIETWTVHRDTYPQIDFGLVSDPYGFEDSPDAEIVAAGLNAKGPRSVALGRHGNWFHWGFVGAPDRMTPSAQRVFVNAICYMRAFEGRTPLVEKLADAREKVFVHVEYLRGFGDASPSALVRMFPADAREAVGFLDGSPADEIAQRLHAYFTSELEYLRAGFELDDDAKALGVSNRSLSFPGALLARFAADPSDALATRLVARYFDPADASDAASLRAFVAANRGRLFFSDVGGYRWFVDRYAPPPAPDEAAPRGAAAQAEPIEGERVRARLSLVPPRVAPGGWVEARVTVELDEGWRTAAPTSPAGLALFVEGPSGWSVFGDVLAPAGEPVEDPAFGRVELLQGRFVVTRRLRVPAEAPAGRADVRAALGLVVGDPFSSLPPQQLVLAGAVEIAPDAPLGPSPPPPSGNLALTEAEFATLQEQGVVVRAWLDQAHVARGDELFATVEVVIAPGHVVWRPAPGIATDDGAVRVAMPFVAAFGGGARSLEPLAPPPPRADGGYDRPFRAWLPLVLDTAEPGPAQVHVRMQAHVGAADADGGATELTTQDATIDVVVR